jgi:hypothetical protein
VSLKTLRLILIPTLALVALAAWPDAAEAQRRGPGRQRVVVRGGLYRPVFVSPWYGYGYASPWFPYRYAQIGYPYGPYGYYGRLDELTSAVRLDVTPRTAEVFVDGYRAGTVDDFDGIFQRLRLRPGEHDLTVHLDGYRTLHERVYLSTGADERIRHTMVPLPAGESQEPRPEPPARAEPPARPDPPARAVPSESAAPFGSLSIRVQPVDAEILIDGERWTGPATQERLVVQLSGGRHRVEVRREGHESYSSDVNVRAGEAATLNISLPRRP